MTKEQAAKKFMKLPVLKNGVYFNPSTNLLEFWFVFKGRKAKIGECKLDVPDGIVGHWEQSARDQVRDLLKKTFGTKLVSEITSKKHRKVIV